MYALCVSGAASTQVLCGRFYALYIYLMFVEMYAKVCVVVFCFCFCGHCLYSAVTLTVVEE